MLDSRVRDGVSARESVLTITGGRIEGQVALALDGSLVDAAGVRLHGQRAAVQAEESSRVLLSATEVRSPATGGSVHGVLRIADGAGL